MGGLPSAPTICKSYSLQQIYWMRLIKANQEEEIEMLATKVPEIEEAYKVMKRLSQDEEVRLLYESREKAIRDEQARLYGAREEGKRDEAIEVARNLFKMGFSVEQVTQVTTKLTVREAEELQGQTALPEKSKSTKRRKVPSPA